MPIDFHAEDVTFPLSNESLPVQFLDGVVASEDCRTGDINIVFCGDAYLHKLNKTYLNHDTLTDIITFDYSANDVLSGDMFISIERARENAEIYNVSLEHELNRLFVHGVLHLAGYSDKTKSAKRQMKAKEDSYLQELSNPDVSHGNASS